MKSIVNNKKKLILLCILFMILVTSGTFAFYNWRSNDTKVNIGIKDLTVDFTSGPDVIANNIGPVLDYHDGVIQTFRVTNGGEVQINYSVSLDINNISDNLLNDSFKYKLLRDNNGGVDYTEEVVEGDFSKFRAGNNVITTNEFIGAGLSYSYQFIIYIDGNMKNDITIQENSMSASLEVKEINLATNYIKKLYYDGSDINKVHIGGDNANPEVSLNSKQGLMLDNNGEYRYYGSRPNNYVKFNNELWRIISISNVKTSEDDIVGEERVKLIRDESIGIYSWDSSDSSINNGTGVNDWTKADLNTLLNDYYYNGKDNQTCYNGINNASTTCNFSSIGLKAEAKEMIGDALWYLGSRTNLGQLTNFMYEYERSNGAYVCSTDDGACPRSTRWVGKVGLMYVSDQGYATDLSVCKETMRTYNVDACINNDWLSNREYQWTISPYAYSAAGAWYISRDGDSCVSLASQSTATITVRPTVYLKSTISILEGTGSSTDPYILKNSNDLASEYIKKLYNDGSSINKVHIGGNNTNPEVSLNSKQSIMLDNNGEYRYYGSNPNNYVLFNNELWRIISVSNVKSSEEDTVGEERVKLIRETSIGNYSWDSSESSINEGYGVNNWTQSDSNTLLNEYYYKGLNNQICYHNPSNQTKTCSFNDIKLSDKFKQMIDNAVWNLGDVSASLPHQFYISERNQQTSEDIFVSRIGLMYPSDYGYATDLSLCTSGLNRYDNDGCKNNNWLYLIDTSKYKWTITSPYDTNFVCVVDVTGLLTAGSPAYGRGIYPVVYLKSSVSIVEGVGTRDVPYKLLLEDK